MNYKNQELRVFVSFFKILRKRLAFNIGNISLINRTREMHLSQKTKISNISCSNPGPLNADESFECSSSFWVFLSSSSRAYWSRHLSGWCVKCLPVASRSVVPPCKARDCSFQWMCVLDSLKTISQTEALLLIPQSARLR